MAVTETLLGFFRHRLKAISLALLTIAGTQVAVQADSELDMSAHAYFLEPGLIVLKPSIAYMNNLSLDTILSGRFTIDRVESGTGDFDSISGASQITGATTRETDYRQEYNVGVSHVAGQWIASAGYVYSYEEDYRSNTPSLSLARDFNQRNTTLSFGYAHNFDRVHGKYMATEEDKQVDAYSLGLTQVLSESSLINAAYTRQLASGYLATGNRRILLTDDTLIDEYLPSRRDRQAVGIRAAKWLPFNSALHVSYRYYQDDWELRSHTLNAKYYIPVMLLGQKFKVRLESRFYTQTGVYFNQSQYDGTEKYLTSANSLKPMVSILNGIKISHTLPGKENITLNAKLELYENSRNVEGFVSMISTQWKY